MHVPVRNDFSWHADVWDPIFSLDYAVLPNDQVILDDGSMFRPATPVDAFHDPLHPIRTAYSATLGKMMQILIAGEQEGV